MSVATTLSKAGHGYVSLSLSDRHFYWYGNGMSLSPRVWRQEMWRVTSDLVGEYKLRQHFSLEAVEDMVPDPLCDD